MSGSLENIADRGSVGGSQPSGKAFVWFTDTSAIADPDQLTRWESVLSEDERARHRAFRFASDRQLFLIAHALLRTTLSRYSRIEPQDWRFTLGEFGRPEIAADQRVNHPLRFNLSHTPGLAACVVARNLKVGIDVERPNRSCSVNALAKRYFTHHETQQLAKLSGEARLTRFLEYWTLKEAYTKARGGGLSIPLDSFAFRLDNERWQIDFNDTSDDPDDWQFVCFRPTADHIISLAIHRPNQPNCEVELQQAVLR
ncbi:MAG: 4'-phosphopantetheinyl transferase superfamily protein [Planctomycetes bacterium]|nr:4'-phosphopantetheinyl transferase superfamily protein [Planctomycetota bacterium]